MTLHENYKMHEQIGKFDMLVGLVIKNKLSKSEAIEESGLTEAEFEKYLKEYTEKPEQKPEQKPHSL